MQIIYLIAIVLLLLCLLLVGRLTQRERKLRDSERRFAAFMDNTPSIAFIRDDEGRIVYVNSSGQQRLGICPGDWQGKTDFALWPSDAEDGQRQLNRVLLSEGRQIGQIETVTHHDGSKSQWLSHKFPLHDGRGRAYLAGIAIEITEQKRLEDELRAANAQLERLSLLDGLTGLNNRRAFDAALAREIDRARRYKRSLSLLLIDVDKFKTYNDTWGHLAGDDVLRQVGQILQDKARITDVPARYGGEEFAVVLPDTDGDGAVALAERLRLTLEEAAWTYRPVTASIGVGTWSDGMTGEELAALADAQLYRAKENGRNRVAFAADDVRQPTAKVPM